MPPQNQQKSLIDQWRQDYNTVRVLAAVFAAPVETICRQTGTMGENYPAPFVLALGFLWLLVFPGLVGEPKQAMPLYLLGGVALIASAAHNYQRQHMPIQHSRFRGFTRFGISYDAEALVVAGSGFLTLGLNTPLGLYLILAGLSLAFSNSATIQHERSMLRAMHDAEIEQHYLVEKYRRKYGLHR